MTINSSVWPQLAPAYSAVDNNMTVYRFLRDTPLVEKVLTSMLAQRFFADKVFAAGPSTQSGAVGYSQILGEGSYYTSRDVQSIRPGSEFPNVGLDEETLNVAVTTKWGGRIGFPQETIDRDRRDVLGRGLIRLANTIARKIDTQAIAALNAAPVLTAAASADWTTSNTNILGDIQTAQSAIENSDLGYSANLGLLNPAQALDIRKNTGIQAAMPRETTTENFLWARDLDGIAGLTYYVSNRVPAGTVWILQAGMIGSISDERPFYSKSWFDENTEEWRLRAARMFVPYVTDPKAAFKITSA